MVDAPQASPQDGLDEADELRAPAPVQNRTELESERDEPFLEDVQSPAVEEADAAAPVHRGHPTQHIDLEDQPTHEGSANGISSGIFPNVELKKTNVSEITKQLAIVGHLTFFSILGTLARLGIQWLTFYPGAPVTTSLLWANIGGSYIMGFLSEDRNLFQHPLFDPEPRPKGEQPAADFTQRHSKIKKTIPLYVGLATGFCGSFTSFSSFMRDAFLALSNDLPAPLYHPVPAGAAPPAFSATHPRDGGYSLLSVLAVLIYEPGLSLAALFVGAHTALLLDRITPAISYRLYRRFLDPAAIVLGLGAWLAAVLIAIFPPNDSWRGEVLFALVFAPAGCIARFYVSLYLNPLVKSFPTGTFVVNMFGSAMLAMSYDLQRVRIGGVAGGSVVGCQVLQGIEDGFCGCLTTVSTWVAEIQGLRRRHAYVYAIVSMAAGLALMVVIMGSVRWSAGWAVPVCVTMRTSS